MSAPWQVGQPVPFSRPSLGPAEEEAVLRVLRSGWLTTAGEALAFEKEFAQVAGSPHALAVNSATSGLHLALEAIGIGPGDQVAVSPYTFTASCEVMRYLGADPAFVDIAPGSFHMDPLALEQRLKEDRAQAVRRIKAIMPVHIGGIGLFEDEYLDLGERFGIPVIEDAAHCVPARDGKGRLLGSRGEIGVYSFYANKTITTGEGGMVVCRDDTLARRMKVMRSHGIDRDVWTRYTGTTSSGWQYAVVAPGYKYNMPDMAAAIGRVQLGRAQEFLESRRSQALSYHQALAGIDWLQLPPCPDQAKTTLEHSWHLYTLQVPPTWRDRLAEWMSSRQIGVSVHYTPLHVMPYYADRYCLAPSDYPQADLAGRRALSLPLWPGLTPAQQDWVIQSLLAFPQAPQARISGEVPE